MKTLCLMFALLFLPFPTAAQPPPDKSLDQKVRAEINAFKGKVTLFAKNLDTGASYGIGENERVRTASTIKVPIKLNEKVIMAKRIVHPLKVFLFSETIKL